MNNNRRPPVRPVGGADQGVKREGAQGAQQQRRQEYTQMPLRPMTSMSRDGRNQHPPVEAVRPDPRPRRPEMSPVNKRPAPQQQPRAQQGVYQPRMQQPRMQQQQGARPPRPQQPRPQRPPSYGAYGAYGAGQAQYRPRPDEMRRPAPPYSQAPRSQGVYPPRPDPRRPAGNGRAYTDSGRRPPEKRPQNGWVIPEGSPVYTAEGRMYESRKSGAQRPSNQSDMRKRAPNGYSGANNRPRRPAPAKKKKKRFNKERFLLGVKTFFIRFAVMILAVSLLLVWWYRAEFFTKSDDRSGKVTFTLEGVGSYETKASLAYRKDVLYCDFTEIAGWLGMVSVGSVNSMRFICTEGVSETSSGHGAEEYAIFTGGSSSVIVNGTGVCLEAPCRTVNSHIWVPFSFVENYISGIVCDRGAKGTDVSIAPEGAEEKSKKDDEKIEINADFKLKAQSPLSHVEYPE